MAKVDWPSADKRVLIGKRIDRVDGPAKATGSAKYSFDINRPAMLWAKVLVSPYARAEIVEIDLSGAKSLKSVEAVWTNTDDEQKKIEYAGQIVAAVAAVTEEIAQEAIGLIKVQYKPL